MSRSGSAPQRPSTPAPQSPPKAGAKPTAAKPTAAAKLSPQPKPQPRLAPPNTLGPQPKPQRLATPPKAPPTLQSAGKTGPVAGKPLSAPAQGGAAAAFKPGMVRNPMGGRNPPKMGNKG
jgi:hypothetical protein